MRQELRVDLVKETVEHTKWRTSRPRIGSIIKRSAVTIPGLVADLKKEGYWK